LLVVVAVLALVCAFVLGRASVSGVAAAPGGVEPESAQPQDAPRSEVPASIAPAVVPPDAQPHSPAEQALLDQRNVYTIKVVEYYRSELNIERARETLRYLTEVQGLPACSTTTSTRIYVLIGAAPAKTELDQLLLKVRTMAGPPPLSRPAEFFDAYPEKIDKVFPRNP
jgi:hypothetical protein